MDTPVLRHVERLDSIPLGETYWTEEGYLRDKPIVTSVGIFEYKNKDGTTRRELRLPEHVFDPESLASYRGKPVILTHRAGSVDKDNVDREHIGTILSEGIPDGDNVRVEIIIHDTDIIKQTGLRELSLGYSLDLDETPGVWNGQHYDAVQTNIRINHLALVDKARAGEQARLNIDSRDDNSEGGSTMDPKNNLTPEELAEAIALYKAKKKADGDPAPAPADPKSADGDDKSAKKTDSGDGDKANGSDVPPKPASSTPTPKPAGGDPVKAVKDRRDSRKADGDPKDTDSAKKVIAQQDEDIDTLLKIIEQMKAKSDFDSAPSTPAAKKDSSGCKEDCDKPKPMNADSVDAIVRERVSMLRLCDRLNLDGADNMTISQMKKAIIKSVKPTMRLDGQSETYINAAFDIARDEINARKDTNYQRRQMFNTDSAGQKPAQPAGALSRRQQMIDDMDGGKQ